MDPDVRKTLMELNRPRGKFRTQVLKKSQEKVRKNIKTTFGFSRVLKKIGENIPKCSCTRQLSRAFCTELFPFWGIMKKYSIRKYLLADFVAGLTVGIIHIPQGKNPPILNFFYQLNHDIFLHYVKTYTHSFIHSIWKLFFFFFRKLVQFFDHTFWNDVH